MSTNTPTLWSSKYSADDKKQVTEVLMWLNDKITATSPRERTRVSLSNASGVSLSLLSQILKGSYEAPPTKFLDKMMDSTRHWNTESVQPDSLVETSVYSLVNVACDKARERRSFSIVSGAVGVGKTCCLIDYVERNPGCIYLRGVSTMNPSAIVDRLLEKLSLKIKGISDKKLEAVFNAFRHSNRLIVLDEADKVPPKTLETLRSIRDEAKIGILLAGTQDLRASIGQQLGQFDQIRSRVVYFPDIIQCLSTDDVTAIAAVHLSGIEIQQSESFTSIVNCLKEVSAGSARVLIENLFPSIKKILKNHPEWTLNCGLIRKISKDILGFSS